MPHVQHALLAFSILAALTACDGAVDVYRSAQVVDVSGRPTRVLTLRLEERSPGEPVLFLFAGGGSPMEAWGEWIAQASFLAPLVTYDRPGIGESPFDGVDPTPERVIEHAREVLETLGVAPPLILVGHSWGGPLIRYYAGAYPDDIVGLVYLDPTDMEATPAEAAVAADDEELQARQAELDSVRARSNPTPGRAAEMRVVSGFLRTQPADRGLPPDLDVPTTVVLGTLAPDISSEAPSYVDERWFEALFAGRVGRFTEWAQARPNRTLLVLSDAGHFVHRDRPDETLEAVRRLVGDVEAGR